MIVMMLFPASFETGETGAVSLLKNRILGPGRVSLPATASIVGNGFSSSLTCTTGNFFFNEVKNTGLALIDVGIAAMLSALPVSIGRD